MKTPVLFIIFNRPDTTALVFEEIRKARPPQLFVAGDGPRDNRPGEDILCQKTRDIIKNVDWSCEVKTLYQEKNLGCKLGVSTAINWFFKNIEQGIILEDDCLPNPSFFEFCEVMLEKYKNEEGIGVISGSNFVQEETLREINPEKNEYYFIRPIYIWGWATWRRSWDKYDIKMRSWPNAKKQGYIDKVFKNKNVANFYNHLFQYAYVGGAKTWDIQWLFSCLRNNMLCIVPPRNIISNIGVNGTHSNEQGQSYLMNMYTESFSVNKLRHPENISVDYNIEKIILNSTLADRFSYRIFLIKILELLNLDNVVRIIYRRFKLKL